MMQHAKLFQDIDGRSATQWEEHMIVYGGPKRDRVWFLHVPTSTWSEVVTKGEVPEARRYHSAVVWNGKLLVTGGELIHEQNNDVTLKIHALDLHTHMWAKFVANAVPTNRTHHNSVVCNEQLLLFGGKPSDTALTTGELIEEIYHGFYDLNLLSLGEDKVSTWQRVKMRDFHTPKLWGATAVPYRGTHVFFFGGFDVSVNQDARGEQLQREPQAEVSDQTYVLDMRTCLWQRSVTDRKPPARALHTAVVHHKEMLVFGGVGAGASQTLNDFWRYNIPTGLWTAVEFGIARWPSRSLPAIQYGNDFLVAPNSSTLMRINFLDVKPVWHKSFTTWLERDEHSIRKRDQAIAQLRSVSTSMDYVLQRSRPNPVVRRSQSAQQVRRNTLDGAMCQTSKQSFDRAAKLESLVTRLLRHTSGGNSLNPKESQEAWELLDRAALELSKIKYSSASAVDPLNITLGKYFSAARSAGTSPPRAVFVGSPSQKQNTDIAEVGIRRSSRSSSTRSRDHVRVGWPLILSPPLTPPSPLSTPNSLSARETPNAAPLSFYDSPWVHRASNREHSRPQHNPLDGFKTPANKPSASSSDTSGSNRSGSSSESKRIHQDIDGDSRSACNLHPPLTAASRLQHHVDAAQDVREHVVDSISADGVTGRKIKSRYNSASSSSAARGSSTEKSRRSVSGSSVAQRLRVLAEELAAGDI